MTDATSIIRDWMLQTLKQKDWRPATWARAAGLATSTVAKAIKPDYPFVTSTRTLTALAQAAGVPLPSGLPSARQDQIAPRFLPVRYRVQAGLWAEAEAFTQAFVDNGSFPVTPDPRYAEWPQWLELVVGDSVDKIIRPDGMAHVVDAIEMGYAPRPGDFVVVERRRNGGQLRERTIKQVRSAPDVGFELWPYSTNPQWNAPIQLRQGAADNEDIEVEIVGLVIGSYNKIA